MKYLRAGSGYPLIFIFLLSCVFSQFLYSFFIYWLSNWTMGEQKRKQILEIATEISTIATNRTTKSSHYFSPLDDFLHQMDTKTGVYGITGITLGLFPFAIVRDTLFFTICLKASIKLHDRMFKCVTRTPLLFFQTNPIGMISNFQNLINDGYKIIFLPTNTGRILNRFSKDIGCIDNELPIMFMEVITVEKK